MLACKNSGYDVDRWFADSKVVRWPAKDP